MWRETFLYFGNYLLENLSNVNRIMMLMTLIIMKGPASSIVKDE